jgi:hypothetical protein
VKKADLLDLLFFITIFQKKRVRRKSWRVNVDLFENKMKGV